MLEFEAAVASNDFGRAAALYAGAFLDGFFVKEAAEFDRWADEERARLERLHARARANLREEPPLPSLEHAGFESTPSQPTRVSAPQVSAPQVSAPQVSAPQVSAPQVSATPQSVDAPRFEERTPKRKHRSRVAALGLAAAIVLTLAASFLSRRSPMVAPLHRRAVVLPDTAPGSALEFNRADAGAVTDKGYVV